MSPLIRDMERRLMRACAQYSDAVVRKYELKLHYMEQYTDNPVKAIGKMVSDSRYRMASEDWRDAMAEMTAVSAALSQLREMETR